MRKHINSTDKFIDVNTGTLVLDATPTEGSFNSVTSDGVAKAIAQGGGGSYSAGNGVSISEGTISAKVDGSTIGFDASGNLKSLASGGGDIYYVQGSDTPVTIMEQVNAGKVPVLKKGSNLYYMADGNGSMFTRTSALGTNAPGYLDGYIIEDSADVAIHFTNNIAPSFIPTTRGHRGDDGKVLTARPNANMEMELSWADRSVYIIDFGDYANWDSTQKQQTASLLNTLASSGTTIPVAKFDSIRGGSNASHRARFLPLQDFYFNSTSDFQFTFATPFYWYDSEESTQSIGLEFFDFYQNQWSSGYAFDDSFFKGTFSRMNPAPHR